MDNSRFKFRAWDKRYNMMIGQLADGYRFALSGDIQVIGSDLKTIRNSDEFEVMQWTGLKDKSGVDVYEKDIVLLNNGARLVVEYDDCSVTSDDNYCGSDAIGFYLNDPSGECFDEILGNPSPWNDNATDTENIEMIGNIYENPELLKD